jgi:hypothetical protein
MKSLPLSLVRLAALLLGTGDHGQNGHLKPP